jgi:hypothetical protein
MKSLATCLILAVALITGGVAAAHAYTFMGTGTDTCGSWTANRAENAKPGPLTSGSLRALQQAEWIVGFLSGIGAMGETKGFNPLNGIDGAGVRAWFDNYCREHPLETIDDAGHAFLHAHPH